MDFIKPEDVYKFVDDAAFTEVINLVSAGLACYNFKKHIAADISKDNQFLPPENVKSNQYLDTLNEWTVNNQMHMNYKKTKYMIFNFFTPGNSTPD